MFEQLRAIQREFGYLPGGQRKALSVALDIPLSRIHAVAGLLKQQIPPKTEP